MGNPYNEADGEQQPEQDGITLRCAVEADLGAIVDIYNSTIASRNITADTVPVSVESRQGWFHDHSPDTHPIWVAENQHQVVGWLSLQPFHDRPAYRATAEISIYVSPQSRRQGIGQQLLGRAIAQSPALNISTLVGLVFAQNKPSLRLLQRFGFQQWGFLPEVAQFDVGTCDLIIMGRKV
jgi:phosphinothricin acetyltransferase